MDYFALFNRSIYVLFYTVLITLLIQSWFSGGCDGWACQEVAIDHIVAQPTDKHMHEMGSKLIRHSAVNITVHTISSKHLILIT